jgi:hypothetical protein
MPRFRDDSMVATFTPASAGWFRQSRAKMVRALLLEPDRATLDAEL